MKTFFTVMGYMLLMLFISYQAFGPEDLNELGIDFEPVKEIPINGVSLHELPVFNDGDPEVQCLAENIYHEARNQSIEGMTAVAAVTINRMKSVDYPNTICEVIYEPYQFSWTIYGKEVRIDNAVDATAWDVSQDIAKKVLHEGVPYDMMGVYYYHADYVNPKWALAKMEYTRIERHIFYKNRI